MNPVLPSLEWHSLYAIKKQTQSMPVSTPTIRDMVRMVASTGGFLCRKSDGEPGPITIWRGLIELSILVQGYLFFSNSLHPRGQPTYV